MPTGEQERIPLRFALPATLAPGKYELSATVKFSTGETQKDSFTIDVLPRPAAAAGRPAKIALFDPKGETGKLLDRDGRAVPAGGGRRRPVAATTSSSWARRR